MKIYEDTQVIWNQQRRKQNLQTYKLMLKSFFTVCIINIHSTRKIFTLLDKASPIVLYFHLFGISQSKRSKRISREQINQHTISEPCIWFNLMNQHFWGKNIKIYHKNATGGPPQQLLPLVLVKIQYFGTNIL